MMIGTTVGTRFHIVSRVGEGWLFIVYQAQDRLTGQRVAVKTLRPTFITLSPFVAALRRACEQVTGISHPSLLRYLTVGEVDEAQPFFWVCELVAGQSLGQLLGRRLPLPLTQALHLLIQIADGVAYLHRQGIVHGDLRPHNILVTSRGEVKVGDYGLSSAFLASRVTETEWMERVAPYLAPERFHGDEGTPQSDIYALGVLLFQMVTGRLPYEAATIADLAHLHATAPIPLPSSLNPSVPFSVDALVLQAMAKDPHRRFPSVDAFRDNLQEALAALETIPSPIPPVPAEPPSEKEEATDEEERPVWRQVTQSVLASVIGLIVGLVFVGLLVYSLLVSTRPREVVVPDVTGMPLTKAEQLLKERGLQLRVVRWQPSKDIPPNHILRMEDPEPNRRVLEGREVLVVVSQGVAPVLVPDVTGQKLEDALTTLRGAHLKVGQKVETFSETAPAGTVVGQQPPPLTQVPEDTPVNLIVSKGAPPPEPEEIDWRSVPPDAKVARVSLVVGGHQLQQLVQIQVNDAQGFREVYRGVHVPGDRVSKTVIVRGSGRIRVLVNGQLAAPEQEL